MRKNHWVNMCLPTHFCYCLLSGCLSSILLRWVHGHHFINLFFHQKKSKSIAVPLHAMKAPGSCSFLTSALDGVNGQHHAPAALYPRGKDPGTHWTGGWVGPRAGLDAEARRKVLCLCRRSNPGRPVRSQTLYRLSYRGSCSSIYEINI
jgi:hypothetical protein